METEIKVINLGFVNAFLVDVGDGFILIDTGIGPTWKQLESQLQSAGCLPDHLKLVVITHGDMDHIGSCAVLKEKYHARIAMHPADVPLAESGKSLERTPTSAFTKVVGLVGKVGSSLQGDRPVLNTFSPDILLRDGQRLDEYGLAARVIHTPGHTPGEIAILTDDGALFAGDTFSNTNAPGLGMYVHNLQQYKESLVKLKNLDAKMVYPGHGKPFPYKEIMPINF